MLKSDEIQYLREKSETLLDDVKEFLISDICRRVAQAGKITGSAAYQIYKAKRLGISEKEIQAQIKKRLGKSKAQITQMFRQAAGDTYMSEPTVPFEEDTALQRLIEACIDETNGEMENITRTMGMRGPDGKDYPLREAYTRCMDYAFTSVAGGRTDYGTAIRRAVKNLGDMGVRSIDYESGVSTSLEAAVRRNVMGGLGIVSNRILEKERRENGFDGWEISAHARSAPDHEPYQGRQYTIDAYERLNRDLKRPIGTLNCGHIAFPVMLGVNRPQYTEEELRKFIDENKKGVTYGGRHYTLYEATQQQRRYERSIRREKDRITAYTRTEDKAKLQQSQIRYMVLKTQYAAFSKAADLPTQADRVQKYGFTSEHGREARKEYERRNK